ncbi:hypothetical protein NC652_010961 [Populus alba x Populus x berolinensis]|nr:hypothetical protein NC652_010961 [Populus alba x Populus x berolinensis]
MLTVTQMKCQLTCLLSWQEITTFAGWLLLIRILELMTRHTRWRKGSTAHMGHMRSPIIAFRPQ